MENADIRLPQLAVLRALCASVVMQLTRPLPILTLGVFSD